MKSHYDKICDAIGKDTKEEMDKLDTQGLEDVIVQATTAKETARAELMKNPKYQDAKDAKSLLESGRREVNKRQDAKIAYALIRIAGDDQGQGES